MEQRPSKEKRRITRWDLFKVFLFSFFLQSVWNFRSLLSVGFSACLFPVLNKLYEDPEEKREFLLRHLRFFNSHPYLASFALGVSIRLEEMRANGEEDNPEIINRIKELLISPLGAIGDRLFWATIKPATLISGMVLLLLAPTVPAKTVAICLVFLLYNVPHLYFRYRGIIEGYNHPMEIHRFVNQERFSGIHRAFTRILAFSTPALVLVYGYRLYQQRAGLLIVFAASVVYTMLMRRWFDRFYLVTLATFIFFLTVGILFY